MNGNELLDVCTRHEGYDMYPHISDPDSKTVVEFIDINELRNVIDHLPFILESIKPTLYNRCMVIMYVIQGIIDIGDIMIYQLSNELFQVTSDYQFEICTVLKNLSDTINNDSFQRSLNRAKLTGILCVNMLSKL